MPMDGGWREGLTALLVLVGAYLVVTLMRLARVWRRKRPAEPPVSRTPPFVPEEADAEEGARSFVAAAYGAAEPLEVPEGASAFEETLQRVTEERSEIDRLRAEVVSLREEMAELRAAQRVSPQYADAMALAQRGLGTQDIADRCEISLAEAELVLSLSRGQTGLEGKDDHGGESGRPDA